MKFFYLSGRKFDSGNLKFIAGQIKTKIEIWRQLWRKRVSVKFLSKARENLNPVNNLENMSVKFPFTWAILSLRRGRS